MNAPINLADLKFDPSNQGARNRELLKALSNDDRRAALYDAINQQSSQDQGRLVFCSRDVAPRQHCHGGLDAPRPLARPDHLKVTLVTDRDQIEKILRDPVNYSNRVYAELGDGNFMLALDPMGAPGQGPDAHTEQREAFKRCFPHDRTALAALAHAAWQAAAVLGLRGSDFDLAELAEQAALRCCQLMMGYPTSDFPLLESSLRIAYRALVHQVMERHFVSDPVLIPSAKGEMGRLLRRTSALIDAFGREDLDDVTKGWDDPLRPRGITPALKALGELDTSLNGEQLAVVAVGAAIGTVGNVQAAICIAVRALFAKPSLLQQAIGLACRECLDSPTGRLADWQKLITGPLRENPPIPFLPRVRVDQHGQKQEELLLALGGGTRPIPGQTAGQDDPLLWGLSPAPAQAGQQAPAMHWCAGQALAWPLIVEVVRQVMALPDIAQALDPETGQIHGLEKRNGFACVSYPLTHRRDRRVAQTSLNVAMRIRPPRQDNADRLRSIIRAGAPRIEQALRQSRHVHFAWFELIEQDTVLVLHTVYDGPFGAYLQHFARQVGDLFDMLFAYIEDPPPMPVAKFPVEFEAHLLRYDRPPAMGYFFSAYPDSEVAQIVRQEGRGP